MPPFIRHDAPSQRRHYRVTAPISATISGHHYPIANWSLSGFKIDDAQNRLQLYDIVTAYLKIPFHGIDLGFAATAKIVRIDDDKKGVAAEFINLGERERQTLESFAQGIVSGEMEEVDGIIRRLDLPVTPASLKPDAGKQQAPHLAEEKRRKGMRFYKIAGIALALIVLTVLYTNIFQLKVTTAVAMGDNDVIISPTVADITSIAPLNTPISAGTPILTLADQKLDYDIKLAQLRMQDARVEVSRLDAALELEKQRLQAASGIVSKEWSSSADTVRTLKKNLDVKQASLQRIQDLAAQGFASQLVLDKVRGEYLDAERQLNEARQAEAKLAQEFSTVKGGFQVRDQMVVEGIQDTEELRKAAVEKLSIAQAELEFLQDRKIKLAIAAPADGRLVRVFAPQNTSVKYGDPIAVFQKGDRRIIKVFLTQEEALHITPGQKASVYFPYRWWSVDHKVTDIDFYSLTLSQSQGQFQWQNLQNNAFKTVIATLEPISDKETGLMQEIAPGTAATVVFNLLF